MIFVYVNHSRLYWAAKNSNGDLKAVRSIQVRREEESEHETKQITKKKNEMYQTTITLNTRPKRDIIARWKRNCFFYLILSWILTAMILTMFIRNVKTMTTFSGSKST